jgi:flavin reductase (DIM6/NTAB) family NADH-FMN oxidoreductase RutF
MQGIFKKLSYGHYIVTARKPADEMATRNEDYLSAGTVSWAMQSSFEPPMLTIAVRLNQDLHETIDKSGRFSLHILTETQDPLVKSFGQTSEITDQAINGVPYQVNEEGLLVLEGMIGYLDCEVQDTLRSGDHMLIVGKVRKHHLSREEAKPLHTAASAYFYEK